jgi:Fungal specific transcription factor domain
VARPKPPFDDFQVQFAEPSATKNGEKTPVNIEKYGKAEGGRRTLTTHHRNYLQAVGAFRVLPKLSQDAMITTYISCIHGLLPILDGTKLLRDFAVGNASIFLIQAICLITCKIPEVAQYLRLYEDGPLLDPIPFARSLHIGLDAAMKADLEPDRMTKVQILTLMHLHNDGPGGIEESSSHLSQAIHDAWTAGLHIQTPGRTTKDEASLLWWMIWTLDRINACIGGRPIMIADRDIDLGRPPLEVNSRAPITVWIRLGDLLDQIIDFYRPTADPDASGWEAEFPSWQSMLTDIDLEDTLDSHLTVLELCYNVIAIL